MDTGQQPQREIHVSASDPLRGARTIAGLVMFDLHHGGGVLADDVITCHIFTPQIIRPPSAAAPRLFSVLNEANANDCCPRGDSSSERHQKGAEGRGGVRSREMVIDSKEQLDNGVMPKARFLFVLYTFSKQYI